MHMYRQIYLSIYIYIHTHIVSVEPRPKRTRIHGCSQARGSGGGCDGAAWVAGLPAEQTLGHRASRNSDDVKELKIN